METLLVTVPSDVVDSLCADRVGSRPVTQRGAAEVVAVVINMTAFVGDLASIVVARRAFGELIRRILSLHATPAKRPEVSFKMTNGLEVTIGLPADTASPAYLDDLAIRVSMFLLNELEKNAGA